ncbi:thioesterase II family protein [Micromonospora lutea]|nr:alpha/beta fold hydrolase [Micromonospora lutea]
MTPTPVEPRASLVVCPHAGGSAAAYLRLVRACPSWLATMVVQYPGRAHRIQEPFSRSIGELAAKTAEAILTCVDGPVALLGHSMGSLVALETARILAAEGREPVALHLSGRGDPSSPPKGGQHLLSDAQLIEHICALGGTDRRIFDDAAMRALALQVIRADYRVLSTYRYHRGRLLHCPVTVLNGAEDTSVPVASATSWAEVTHGAFTHHVFPGDHFFILDHAEAIADLISSALLSQLPPAPTGQVAPVTGSAR